MRSLVCSSSFPPVQTDSRIYVAGLASAVNACELNGMRKAQLLRGDFLDLDASPLDAPVTRVDRHHLEGENASGRRFLAWSSSVGWLPLTTDTKSPLPSCTIKGAVSTCVWAYGAHPSDPEVAPLQVVGIADHPSNPRLRHLPNLFAHQVSVLN